MTMRPLLNLERAVRVMEAFSERARHLEKNFRRQKARDDYNAGAVFVVSLDRLAKHRAKWLSNADVATLPRA